MIDEYVRDLTCAIRNTMVTPRCAYPLEELQKQIFRSHDEGHKTIIVGNGGSAAIASHTAIDLTKNAGLRAVALNDASSLTCLANDYGYDAVFAKQVEYYGQPGDTFIAISSSGKSPNILMATKAARHGRMYVATFTGFSPDNPLRQMGDLNFYVQAERYGFVEIAHQTLLHYVIDAATH